MDEILSWTFTVMFSSEVAKQWRYVVHLCYSDYEMQHTSRLNPRTPQSAEDCNGCQSVRFIYLKWAHCCCCSIRLVRVYYSGKRRLLASSCLSVRPSAWNSASNGRIFMKFDVWLFFFQKSVEKIQVSLKSENNNEHFTRRPIYIFVHISLFFLGWKMFRKKVVVKIGTNILVQ